MGVLSKLPIRLDVMTAVLRLDGLDQDEQGRRVHGILAIDHSLGGRDWKTLERDGHQSAAFQFLPDHAARKNRQELDVVLSVTGSGSDRVEAGDGDRG